MIVVSAQGELQECKAHFVPGRVQPHRCLLCQCGCCCLLCQCGWCAAEGNNSFVQGIGASACASCWKAVHQTLRWWCTVCWWCTC